MFALGEVGPGRPGHALTRSSISGVTEVGALPSCWVSPSDHRYYDPVGLPLSSARFHHWLIRVVFADKAGKTGLSCSESSRAYVPLPLPRRDSTRACPDRQLVECCLRRDMSGSAPSLCV